MASDRIERLAKLIVEFGANVQRGQLVDLSANVGNEELARAVTAAAYDRGAKFSHYRRIPSLREYVLIAQDEAYVERFTRVDDAGTEWAMSVIEGIDASVELPSIDCVLPLRELYERVELAPRSSLRAVYERPAEEALA